MKFAQVKHTAEDWSSVILLALDDESYLSSSFNLAKLETSSKGEADLCSCPDGLRGKKIGI